MFKELKVRKDQVPIKPLLKGRFPEKEEVPMVQEVKQLSKEESPGIRGGKIGGKVAANKAASAAAIAKILSGIEFPKDKSKIVEYAERNKRKAADEQEEIINTIREIPDRTKIPAFRTSDKGASCACAFC